MKRYASKTVADLQELLKHLKEVKIKGFAFCDEELEEGMRTISASIRNINGKAIASTVVVGMVSRVAPDTHDQLVSIVINSASEISEKKDIIASLNIELR